MSCLSEDVISEEEGILLLNVHGGEKAYSGRDNQSQLKKVLKAVEYGPAKTTRPVSL